MVDACDDEDYIDIDVGSSANLFCFSINSPPQTREFEFQMSTNSQDQTQARTSPADELFYKGKLLPLHLPPRLQMVQNLLQNHNNFENSKEDSKESVPNSAKELANAASPFESCNISPSESRRVSTELYPDECFSEWSTEMSECIGDKAKKSVFKKFKQIKPASLGRKLKASQAYLKSLFTKSAVESGTASERECLSKYRKVSKNLSFGKIPNDGIQISAAVIKSINNEMSNDGGGVDSHRRSFSGAIKWNSAAKNSSSSSSSSDSLVSSSSSVNSGGVCELQFLRRSSSVNSDFETSIDAAIAHCKRSQHFISSRKRGSEGGFYSLSVPRIAACDDQERPRFCSM